LATAGRAEAQTCIANNSSYNECQRGCSPSTAADNVCECYWDAPSLPGAFPVDHGGIGNEVLPPGDRNCWNAPCSKYDGIDECAFETGGTFNSGAGKFEGNRCEWNGVEGECQCKPPLVTIVIPPGVDVRVSPPFDCDCPYVTHEEWRDRIEDGLPCVP